MVDPGEPLIVSTATIITFDGSATTVYGEPGHGYTGNRGVLGSQLVLAAVSQPGPGSLRPPPSAVPTPGPVAGEPDAVSGSGTFPSDALVAERLYHPMVGRRTLTACAYASGCTAAELAQAAACLGRA